jgi:putative FmdB family regulatory protein
MRYVKSMPVYEYLCLKCNKVFTETIRLEEIGKKKPVCPNCGSSEVKKQITPFLTKTSRKS